MIPPYVLTVLMWSTIVVWASSVVAILVQFQIRQRREARAADLMARLTTGDAAADPPELTRSEFEGLVHAGLPQQLEAALAQGLRSHEGDDSLLAIARGETRASIDDRMQALQVIASARHPRMYSVLGDALRAERKEVAAIALRLLKGIDDGEAVIVLVDALADGAYSASRIAAALDRMTAERASRLLPLLQHDSQTVRFWGLLLAGRTRATQWVSVVRTLVTDRAPMVRRAAVEALGRLGCEDDRRLVLARFFDPSAMVRLHAARAAVAFPDGGVAEALVKLLADREWVVRAAARDSLRTLGDVATPAVTKALWHGDAFAANNAAEVLFLTGTTIRFTLELIDGPQKVERRQLVTRLLEASGPQIVRAVLDQLDGSQRAALDRIMGDTRDMLAPVRTQ